MAESDYRRLGAACHCGQPVRAWVGNGRPPKFCSAHCGMLAGSVGAYCVYVAGFCNRCGRAGGKRGSWALCQACLADAAKAKARAAATEAAKAVHRAAARQTTCRGCGSVFCPLYGHSLAGFCDPCSKDNERAIKRAGKAKRRAAQRGVHAESLDPLKVFARDGWRCQLCKRKTPVNKRGTYDDDAPELDHIVPLSKGGPHTYANTQCACRRCNQLKSDRPLGQMLFAF